MIQVIRLLRANEAKYLLFYLTPCPAIKLPGPLFSLCFSFAETPQPVEKLYCGALLRRKTSKISLTGPILTSMKSTNKTANHSGKGHTLLAQPACQRSSFV